MNEHLKGQLLLAITSEIHANPRGTFEPRRVPPKALLSAAAVVAVVGGGVAIVSIDRPDTVAVATDDTNPTTTANADAAYEGGFVFGTPHGRTFLVPGGILGTTPPDGPNYPEGTVSFRLASQDTRVLPMTVSPSVDTFETHVVETVGGRDLRTPNGISYPTGMTEATATGPWMWHEADGTQWMASGLLSDLRIALPDLAYTGGAMVPGASLVRVPVDNTAPDPERFRIRDEQFEFGVADDSTTSFDLVDPRRGQIELVDVGGHPGIRSTGDNISWRVDDHTVISIQRSMASVSGPAPTFDEMLAAARSIRPATVAELRALRVWRGSVDERVILVAPESVRSAEFVGARMTDLDDPNNGGDIGTFNVGVVPYENGFALPLGVDRIGHRLEFRLDLDDGAPTCPVAVTVPPEGAPPVTVELVVDC